VSKLELIKLNLIGQKKAPKNQNSNSSEKLSFPHSKKEAENAGFRNNEKIRTYRPNFVIV